MSGSAWEMPKTPGVNPWTTNAFDPPKPKINAPAPRSRTPRNIPDRHALFVIQKHALDVLHGIRELEMELGEHAHGHKIKHTLRSLERDAENTYRVVRTYLNDYVDGS